LFGYPLVSKISLPKKNGNCKQQPERQDHAHQERAQDHLENAKVPENASVLAAQGGE